jgi:hypothetical protein
MNKSSQLLFVNISTVRLSVPLDDCFTVMPKNLRLDRAQINIEINKKWNKFKVALAVIKICMFLNENALKTV